MEKRIAIDILAHADFAGCLRKTKRTPGLGAFAANIEAVRTRNPEGTLLLDSGDQFCANHWGGKPMVEALSVIGTDAMTLGNHEFDWGEAFVKECVQSASYPILCANVIEKATGDLVEGVKPYAMFERAGVKIGVLGLTTEYTPYMIKYPAFEPFAITSSIEACRRYVPELRAKGAQIVILLTHFPFYVDENGEISGELYDVLAGSPPVEACLGGHIPGDFAGVVRGTAVLKSGFGGVSLGHARLWFDPEQNRVTDMECSIRLTDPEAKGPPAVHQYAEKVTKPFEPFFTEVLAVAEEEWKMRLSGESMMGSFFADTLLEGGQTEIAYMNATSAGGIIPPGPVTVEDITRANGFNEPLMRTHMTGEQLYRLFEHVYVPERFGNNGCLTFSGIIVHVDHTQKSPNKIQLITLRDGTPLDRAARYSVTANAYMASGGNDTSEIVRALPWEDTGLLNHDSILQYLRKHKRMQIYPERRLYEIGTPENDNTPEY